MPRKAAGIIFLFMSIALPCFPEQVNEVRLDSSKPSVYLAFDHLEENGSLWLRLRNNSRWAISFRTENPGTIIAPLGLKDGRTVNGLADSIDISPEYFIENITDRVLYKGHYWCTSTTSWIPPGLSAIFSFPREDLRPVGRIFVSFSYEWEGEVREPEHRVVFSEFDLSNSLKSTSP